MILYHHFISLVLVLVRRCHELFFLRGLGNILPFIDFHPGLKLIMVQGKQQVMRVLIPLVLIRVMVMAMVIAMVMIMVFIIIIRLNCNYVHGHSLQFFLLLLVYLPIFL